MPRRTDVPRGRIGQRRLRLVGSVLAVVAVATPVAPAAADEQQVPGSVLFSFAGDEVFESSGLVDRGGVVYTTNDSGDDAVLYGVRSATGRTVTRTSYAPEVEDVEALAPGADGTVWAGDIGDNQGRREDVVAYRVRPVDGDEPAVAHRLRYPDGPHDAETLLVRPGTQRLFVVSKSAFGGTVYVAPRRLSESGANRLRVFARVRGLVTDGAFLPGGRRVVLRTYDSASVYTFPGFALVGTVRLPYQRQGEAVSVGAGGRVLVSSEGVRAEVLSVRLPTALTRGAVPSAAGSAGSGGATAPGRDMTGPARTTWDWAGIGLVAAGIGTLVYLVMRGSRRLGSR